MKKISAKMASVAIIAATFSTVAAASNADAFTPKPSTSRCQPAGNYVTYPTMYQGQSPRAMSASEIRINGQWCEYNQLHSSVAKVQRKVGASDDGFFGSATRAKVVAFQKAHHLKADGIVGPATLRAMGLVYISA